MPWGAAFIAGEILLLLVLVWLAYDLVTGYWARRRFARLLALKNFWLQDRRSQTAGRCANAYPSKAAQPRRRTRNPIEPDVVSFDEEGQIGRSFRSLKRRTAAPNNAR